MYKSVPKCRDCFCTLFIYNRTLYFWTEWCITYTYVQDRKEEGSASWYMLCIKYQVIKRVRIILIGKTRSFCSYCDNGNGPYIFDQI